MVAMSKIIANFVKICEKWPLTSNNKSSASAPKAWFYAINTGRYSSLTSSCAKKIPTSKLN